MAYLLDNGQTEGVRVYIVGFSVDKILYKPSKIKFLSGLGYAIYVAAFVLEDEEEEDGEGQTGTKADEKELDKKSAFVPRPITSSASLATMTLSPSGNDMNINVWSPKPSRPIATRGFAPTSPVTAGMQRVPSQESDTGDVGLNIDPSSPKPSAKDTKNIKFASIPDESLLITRPKPTTAFTFPDLAPSPPITGNARPQSASPNLVPFSANVFDTHLNTTSKDTVAVPPTWDPVDVFSYPVGQISVKNFVPDNLTFHRCVYMCI